MSPLGHETARLLSSAYWLVDVHVPRPWMQFVFAFISGDGDRFNRLLLCTHFRGTHGKLIRSSVWGLN